MSIMSAMTKAKRNHGHTLSDGKNGPKWTDSLCNECRRLAQGFSNNAVLGTNTINFIHQHEVPSDKKVTMAISFTIVALSKRNHIESVSLLVVTNSCMTTMQDPLRPLFFWNPN